MSPFLSLRLLLPRTCTTIPHHLPASLLLLSGNYSTCHPHPLPSLLSGPHSALYIPFLWLAGQLLPGVTCNAPKTAHVVLTAYPPYGPFCAVFRCVPRPYTSRPGRTLPILLIPTYPMQSSLILAFIRTIFASPPGSIRLFSSALLILCIPFFILAYIYSIFPSRLGNIYLFS